MTNHLIKYLAAINNALGLREEHPHNPISSEFCDVALLIYHIL